MELDLDQRCGEFDLRYTAKNVCTYWHLPTDVTLLFWSMWCWLVVINCNTRERKIIWKHAAYVRPFSSIKRKLKLWPELSMLKASVSTLSTAALRIFARLDARSITQFEISPTCKIEYSPNHLLSEINHKMTYTSLKTINREIVHELIKY